MLELAMLHTTTSAIGEMIVKECENTDIKMYYTLSGYHCTNLIEDIKDCYNSVSYVSLNKYGTIIGFFNSSLAYRCRASFNSLFFKFKSRFDSEEDNLIFQEDLVKYIEMMLTRNDIDIFSFKVFKEHPCNEKGKTYHNIMSTYGGRIVGEFANYGILDGVAKPVIIYEFDTIRDKIKGDVNIETNV